MLTKIDEPPSHGGHSEGIKNLAANGYEWTRINHFAAMYDRKSKKQLWQVDKFLLCVFAPLREHFLLPSVPSVTRWFELFCKTRRLSVLCSVSMSILPILF